MNVPKPIPNPFWKTLMGREVGTYICTHITICLVPVSFRSATQLLSCLPINTEVNHQANLF